MVAHVIAAAVGIGFLTGLSWLVIASLASAHREDERSFPQPSDESIQ